MSDGGADWRAAAATLLGLLGLFVVVRAVFARERGAQPAAAASRPPAAVSTWDAARERDADRRSERRLLVYELLVIALIAGLVALRVIFVDGG